MLTTADRDEKLALLDAEMLGLERLEEFYITVGAQYGLIIERRDDAVRRPCSGSRSRDRSARGERRNFGVSRRGLSSDPAMHHAYLRVRSSGLDGGFMKQHPPRTEGVSSPSRPA